MICRIDEYNAKEVKESIFLVDARENQKALIALAQCNQSCPPSQPQITSSLNTEKVSNIPILKCSYSYNHGKKIIQFNLF